MGYLLVLLLAGLCAIGPVRAHEFWTSPSTFSPARGSTFELSLFVGDFYTGYLIDAIIGLSVVYKSLDNLGAFQRWFGVQPDTRAATLIQPDLLAKHHVQR